MKPHPLTSSPFPSPVPAGSGWPGDPATSATPVAHSPADVLDLAQTSESLADLDARISVCRACSRLVEWREQVAVTKRAAYAEQPYWGRPVPSFGDPSARWLIVGLAPAAHGANRTGRMFTGDRSGDWLYAALHRAGLASQPTAVAAGDGLVLRGVRIVATAHCAPPENRPSPAEKAACAPWLDRELELLGDGLIGLLALGSIGWDAALGAARRRGWQVPRPKPRFGHAAEAVLARPGNHPLRLLGSYHVSQQNTFTGTLTQAMLDDVLAHLRS